MEVNSAGTGLNTPDGQQYTCVEFKSIKGVEHFFENYCYLLSLILFLIHITFFLVWKIFWETVLVAPFCAIAMNWDCSFKELYKYYSQIFLQWSLSWLGWSGSQNTFSVDNIFCRFLTQSYRLVSENLKYSRTCMVLLLFESLKVPIYCSCIEKRN